MRWHRGTGPGIGVAALLAATAPGAAGAVVELAPPATTPALFSGVPHALALAQVNGPATPLDLITAYSQGVGGAVDVRIGPAGSGPGVWVGGSVQGLSIGSRPTGVAVADANGDGSADLAIPGQVGVRLARGAADGIFGAANAITGAPGVPTTGAAFGQLRAGARPDLVTTVEGTVDVYANTNASATPYAARVGTAVDGGTTGVAVGDLDGDGDQDVATAATSTQRAMVLLNDGRGALGVASSAGLFTRPGAVAVADVSGDARAELIVTEPDKGTVAIVSTAGLPASLGPVQRVATGLAPVAVATADLDGDGRAEVVTANAGSDTVTVAEVGGASSSFGAGPTPVAVAIGDVTGDGRPDVVVANDALAGVSVLANRGVPPVPPAPPATTPPPGTPAPRSPDQPSPRRPDQRRRAPAVALSCRPQRRGGRVRRVICRATLGRPAAARTLTARLARSGSQKTLASVRVRTRRTGPTPFVLRSTRPLRNGAHVVAARLRNFDGSTARADVTFHVRPVVKRR